MGLCARFAACLRAAMPRADAPAQTHLWNKDEAGAGNGNGTEWARGQTRVRSRVRKTESVRVQARRGPGSVVWTDAGWLRAHARAQTARYPSPASGDSPPQPRRVLCGALSTCAEVCYSGLLSSQKRLRGGKQLRAPARSRGRPVRLCAFIVFVRAGSDAVCRSVRGMAFRRLLRICNEPGRFHSL